MMTFCVGVVFGVTLSLVAVYYAISELESNNERDR